MYLGPVTYNARVQPRLVEPAPLAKLKAKGSNELAHSMVTSGCVSILYPNGSRCKEEVVWPPRQLTATAAQHIGSGLVENMEKYLFGTSLGTWVQQISSRFGCLNLVFVADSATANLKCISQLFSFLLILGRQYGITVTACYTSCMLHQCARLVALHIEHQALANALFSITRLHQHSNSRDAVKASMKKILRRKFRYVPDQDPPQCVGTCPRFRQNLFKLLTGLWSGEMEAEEATTRKEILKEAITFFNGDILDTTAIFHYCQGCHSSEQVALEHATRFTGLTLIF